LNAQITVRASPGVPEQTDRLQRIQALAEIWGSLYLFHPGIGQRVSQRDWDQVFITALLQVEQAANPAAVMDAIQAHVVQPLADCLPSVQRACMDLDRRVHAGWNEDGYPYVYGQKWEHGEGPPGPFFRPEPPPRAPGPSETNSLSRAERILGLCKVWIVLRYLAPQIALSELDLDTLLSDWLDRVQAAASVEEYYRVLETMAAKLSDPHAGVIAPAEWPPHAAKNDGPAARPPFKRTLLGSAWLGGMRYLRALPGNLVYMIPFAMPEVTALKETFALIQNTNGLILELRGYPKTHFQHELVRCLCQTPAPSPRYEIPVFGEYASPIGEYVSPIGEYASPSGPDEQKRSWKVIQHTIQPDGRAVYTKPVVALIDETTASSAEDFCMYLKIAGRVTFVGRRTAGCVGNATYVNLPGGGRFTFTGMRVTWPDGSPVWGIGIVPDVSVEPEHNGVKAGRDLVLEKGLETLQALCIHEPVPH